MSSPTVNLAIKVSGLVESKQFTETLLEMPGTSQLPPYNGSVKVRDKSFMRILVAAILYKNRKIKPIKTVLGTITYD